ncbi:uroporphyrinogen-III C-methyltransferase [Sporichthya brevicatena]|uniref:Uroporphyrinogen-III C-methyltransferase n=1 Tax=Sporichthya brevicatena TaxID=171442 RepID=A0ABN1GY39_9ACTN
MTDESLPYPVGLRLSGRRVVVVGGGQVAARRVPALLDAHADVVVVSPEATPAIDALADHGRLRWERRPYEPSDLDGAWYALALTADPTVNAAVATDAEARRIFCVRADDATAATAWTAASGRYEGLTLAVLAGRNPRRAAAVRDNVLNALRDGSVDTTGVRERVAGVALVGAGPGDPDLITVRGRQLLAQADVVVADRLAPAALLAELGPHVEVIDASKIPYGRQMAQEAINDALVEHAKAGKFVVRLKGGDNYVFGRGFEEVQACAEAGIPCTVVPGITSSISVPAVAGIPVTHRGVAHEFTVISGHIGPDHADSLTDWAALGRMRGTLVILMGIDKLGAIAAALVQHGRDPGTPAAVIQEGTTSAQRTVRAPLSGIAAAVAEHGIRPPAIVVVGAVVALGDTLPPS